MEEANKLVGAGKKHLVMGKVVEAVNSLQEACGILAKTFGDTADECGEAFFWCGKALLDLARWEYLECFDFSVFNLEFRLLI
ncbi:unnamed protein product [Tetraodon nigroviridis]|uniref:Chromosome 15 SCAF14367, whole genome shotgun sequence n=1 Tax=Tetraodon nigroviridis TaxID=99883 RepID=Q4SSN1_TETNG|nr:unnamed protein product [Tetraodon nigroviridis]